jgi:predicted secreted hydrolase
MRRYRSRAARGPSSVAASLWEAKRLPLRRRSRAAHRAAATVFAFIALSAFAADWKKAEPGWKYEFPRNHHAHREFKTEWWYFTGNLFDEAGRRFGYELTFFRQGIRPVTERDPNASRFIVDDLKFAHFAITDVPGKQFRFEQKMSRGAFGEAGFDDGQRLAWIENWTLALTRENEFEVQAATSFGELRLHLRAVKPAAIHGENGVSTKTADGSAASHYYSLTRLDASGELTMGGTKRQVRGTSWFDHEWSTSQLGRGHVGWDWVSVQWENGEELMLYRMRLADGEADPASSGTWIAADGTTKHLRAAEFQMTPLEFWESKATGGRYPVAWKVAIPGEKIEFTLKRALDDQELRIDPITYWEGAIDASGRRDGQPITGRGYLELTGYAGSLGKMLQR